MTHSDKPTPNDKHLRKTTLSGTLVRLYRVWGVRKVCWRLALALEGGEMTSFTIRSILKMHHGIDVGAYSYGECLKPGSFPEGVAVGRYVSIAAGVKVFRRNHPTERLSTHPFFYNKRLGWHDQDQLPETPGLLIEHDAWIGANVIITPRCHRIGIGAVVGAGSVVTSDVPDFAIAAGTPARILRYRFPPDYQSMILNGRWWELSVEEVMRHKQAMCEEVQRMTPDHQLLRTR